MKDQKKYIGRFERAGKWDSKPFGFIQHHSLGEVFYHDDNKLEDDQILTFTIRQSREGKTKANNVTLLQAENDSAFLMTEFFHLVRSTAKTKDDDGFLQAPQVAHIYNREESDYGKVDLEIVDGIIAQLKKLTKEENRNELYQEFLKGVKSQILRKKLETYSPQRIIAFKKILDLNRKSFPKLYKETFQYTQSTVSTEELKELLTEGYEKGNEIDFVAEKMFNNEKEKFLPDFLKLNDDEKKEVIFKLAFDLEKLSLENRETKIKELIVLVDNHLPSKKEQIQNELVKGCPPYLKLSLWLNNFYDELDFHESKIYFPILNSSEQINFIKKLLYFIKIGKVNLTTNDIISLPVSDYEEAKKLQEEYSIQIDFSTSIVVKIISELSKNTNFDPYKIENTIYETVLKVIKDPSDIPELKGFFDKCEGRCYVSPNYSYEGEEKIITGYEFHRNEKAIPHFHVYCDGRKAIDKKTNNPTLSQKEKLEFWWCANIPCFKPSRELHNNEWEKYTVQDFLTILKIPFFEKDYEILLGIINKANEFFKHLKCHSCEQLLYPHSEGYYSYHRINRFACNNANCTEKGKVVYLNHCLNGHCHNFIDSRSSKKCIPEGYTQEKCGWYVCNNCFACCSSEQIERSNEKRKSVNADYKTSCHVNGHRDLGMIHCYDCGNSMQINPERRQEYVKTLNWFIANKESNKHISKFGQNPKWWFLFKRGDMDWESFNQRMWKLNSMGFQIPNIDEGRDSQLIGEGQPPFELTCTNSECGKIELVEDSQRLSAIRYWHQNFLTKTLAEENAKNEEQPKL